MNVEIPPATQAVSMQLASEARAQADQRIQQAGSSIVMAALTQMFNAGYAQALKDHNLT